MNSINHNSIANLRNWHSTARLEAQSAPFGYDDAVKNFENDVAELKSRDLGPGDPVAPYYGTTLPVGGVEHVVYTRIGTDIDPRPGEVNVPGLGKLQSHDDGFEVARISRNGKLNAKTSNFYSVNEKTGTITVTNIKTNGSMLSGSQKTESYVLDTNSKAIKDYKSDVKVWAPYTSGGFLVR